LNGSQIRKKRVTAGIAGGVLCRSARIDRSRLSQIERGYIQPSVRNKGIGDALDGLLLAKRRLAAVAAEVGWPPEAL
jgi:hypothetical protein